MDARSVWILAILVGFAYSQYIIAGCGSGDCTPPANGEIGIATTGKFIGAGRCDTICYGPCDIDVDCRCVPNPDPVVQESEYCREWRDYSSCREEYGRQLTAARKRWDACVDLKESAEANGDPGEDCTVSYMEFQDAIANMKICEYPSSNPWDLFRETAKTEENSEIPVAEESTFLSIASAEHGGVVCVHPCQIHEGDRCIPNPDPDVRQREDCQWYYQDPVVVQSAIISGHSDSIELRYEETPEIPADEVLEIPDQRRYNIIGQGSCSGC
jgi:hypothetical protein